MMLTVSQQKYLQVIDILEQEQGVVRQIDVAVYLGYSRASVCRAVKSLKAKGLIVQRAHEIELSAYGKALGRQLNEVRTRLQEALYASGFPNGPDPVSALPPPICFKEEPSMIAGQPPSAAGRSTKKK